MEQLALYIALYIGGVVLVVLFTLLNEFYNERKSEHNRRTLLLNQVQRLRLFRMLPNFGIKFKEYAAYAPNLEVCHQIENCKRCKNIQECDHYFHTRARSKRSVVDFCPNYHSLSRLSA